MSMTDPVADFLTRIRNAHMANKKWVDMPSSILKRRIAYVLREESFIRDYILIEDKVQDSLRIFLNYDFDEKPVIHGIKRISKPGCRIYVNSKNLPRVQNGTGIAILTTPGGVMSNKKARANNLGGEVLCYVW